MSCETNCCVFLRGELYIADYTDQCDNGLVCESKRSPYRKLGNIVSSTVVIASQVLGRENKYNLVSNPKARTAIEGVGLEIVLGCASKENIALSLLSSIEPDETSTKIEQFCIDSLKECDFFPFDKARADLESVSVFLKDEDDLVVKTLTIDVDYSLDRSGIKIINNSIDLDGAVTLNYSYNYNTADHAEIDFGIKGQTYKSLFFRGTNYADGTDALFDVYFYKVIFKPIDALGLIEGDEITTLNLQGKVEKVGTKYFKIIKQEE